MPLPARDHRDFPLPPLGQDNSQRLTSGFSIHTSKKLPSSTHLKREFLLRISVFTILELGFIALAYAAGQNPVLLHLPSATTLTEAKGGFTVISILWHALAAFTVKGILLQIFSAEWMEQYRKSGDLVAGETDIVSRITTGYFEQIKYFMVKKATVPFRIGFMCTLLLVVLNALGPSTISVSSITLCRPSVTQVAHLTKTIAGDSAEPWESERAHLIIRLEYLEGTEYGFTVNGSNVLIPWPSSVPTSTHGVATYESDVVTYNFSCSWKQPTINKTTSQLMVDNLPWSNVPLGSTYFDSPIFSIDPFVNVSLNNSPIAFIFEGSNTNPGSLDLDLEDVPSLFIPSGTVTGLTDQRFPLSVSVLICDPQMYVSPATVVVADNSRLQAVLRSGPPIVKNIPLDAAGVIFSESLLVAASSTEFYAGLVNPTLDILFLEGQNKPLSLDKINENMNKILMSSAKAYLSGYRSNGTNLVSPAFEMMYTNATVETQVLALTTGRPFLISLVIVSCILIVLLSFLVVGGRVNELRTFDLENIMRILKVD